MQRSSDTFTKPKISIVVPSFNQGEYLEETLQSLVDQNYRHLEVIIQDAGSTDRSAEVARSFVQRFPDVFQLFIEKDKGQAHGLNLGFQKTTGEILGFLNADDTLFRSCLDRVAKEIDPPSGRYIVMGRCLFTGEGAPYVGIEHPSEYIDHFHQLAIWKRGLNTIPQPSVFWHRDVWERCGGFDETQHHVLDYELFCRFSKRFRFHRVDALWSTYRIHSASKSFSRSETEVLDLSIRASRKHWGPWWSLLRWRCELSYWLHNPQKFEKARHHARLAEEAFGKRTFFNAFWHLAATLRYSPTLAWTRLLAPVLLYRTVPVLERVFLTPRRLQEEERPRYGDGWIGPNFIEQLAVPENASALILRLEFIRPRAVKTEISFLVEGVKVKTLVLRNSQTVSVVLSVGQHRGKTIKLQILSSDSFAPSDYQECDDHRALSMKLLGVRFQ
jgi:glycosyltransferase involved in cell wall biosynthesis